MVRLKSRYLLCKVISPQAHKIQPHDVMAAIKVSLTSLYGSYGCSSVCSKLVIKYMNTKTKFLQLKVAHAHHKMLWSSLPFIKEVYVKAEKTDVQCILQTLYCGATIRSVQKYVVKQDRKAIKAKRSKKDDMVKDIEEN